MEQKKIAFTTLGCKVNLYDTEAMMELFQNRGYNIVEFDDFADIYIINTCTVTNFGDKKSRQMIRRAKRINPDAVVAAVGCYAQVSPDEVEKIEGINIIIGTKERSKVVDIVESYHEKNKVLNTVSDIMGEHEFERLSISKIKGRTRAFLKIQEGCNRFCSYCIIPFARGPVRSRLPQDIIDEVNTLAHNGFKEIVLTGIHVASYGVDLGNINLIEILKRVHLISGIERIRFSSIEPGIITDEFLNEIKQLPKVCRHFHLSLQSGCDKTLKRMNRKYTSVEYYNAVSKIRNIYPDAAITTDLIVGFPGETENDFIESCDFAKKVQLTKIHVFPYSPKKGTAAALYPDQIDNETKSIRSKKMIQISDSLNLQFLENLLGREENVLFERNVGNNIYEGYTDNYTNVIVNSDKDIVNKVLKVKIKAIIKAETVEGLLL